MPDVIQAGDSVKVERLAQLGLALPQYLTGYATGVAGPGGRIVNYTGAQVDAAVQGFVSKALEVGYTGTPLGPNEGIANTGIDVIVLDSAGTQIGIGRPVIADGKVGAVKLKV